MMTQQDMVCLALLTKSQSHVSGNYVGENIFILSKHGISSFDIGLHSEQF